MPTWVDWGRDGGADVGSMSGFGEGGRGVWTRDGWRGLKKPAALDHGVFETVVEGLVAAGAERKFYGFVFVV